MIRFPSLAQEHIAHALGQVHADICKKPFQAQT